MYGLVSKIFNRAAGCVALELGWARRHFAAQRGRIRVLTYHGLVPDEFADRPWVPSHYVSVEQFRRQMGVLAELGPVRPLGEALQRVRAYPDEPPAVCITFDDGMADNATLALPILKQFGHRATFFLTTGCIGPERFLLNDMIRMLRPLYEAGKLRSVTQNALRVFAESGYAKSHSIFEYAPEIGMLWWQHQDEIDPAARRCLAMMTWDQARVLRQAGMEIGAHTINHVILSRQEQASRRLEIVESIARIRSRLGEDEVPFAYPNGLAGDYDEFDLSVLKAVAAPYAVTESHGWNDAATPLLQLRRNCIGRHCSDRAFLAEVFGLRDATAANAA